MGFSLFQILLLSASLLLSLSSKRKQSLTFGAGIFPPGAVVAPESGRCTGHLIDIMNNIFDDSDFCLEIVCGPTIRVYPMLKHGDIDLILTSKRTPQFRD